MAMSFVFCCHRSDNMKLTSTSDVQCAGGLPPGWAAALDIKYQATYFFNASTGERTWQRPAMPAAAPLPDGWAEGTDPRSGIAYYYNTSTGVRQWQRPGGALCLQPASLRSFRGRTS